MNRHAEPELLHADRHQIMQNDAGAAPAVLKAGDAGGPQDAKQNKCSLPVYQVW